MGAYEVIQPEGFPWFPTNEFIESFLRLSHTSPINFIFGGGRDIMCHLDLGVIKLGAVDNRPSTADAPPIDKINPFSKIAVTSN